MRNRIPSAGIAGLAFTSLLLLSPMSFAQAPAAPPAPAAAAPAAAAPPAPPPLPPSTRAPANGDWLETSTEVRLQLDFAVPQAALDAYIPAGWESNIATTGPASRANIRVIFIDQLAITGPDNRILGEGMNQMVYLAAPIKDASGATAQLIIGGISTNPAIVPGPFGNYIQAQSHTITRAMTNDDTGQTGTEHWSFEAATGEYLTFDFTYVPQAINRANSDTRFFSAANPGFYQIFRTNSGTDIAWNATTGVNHVPSYTFSGGGGAFAALFDGTEEILSIDVQHWYEREVYAPH